MRWWRPRGNAQSDRGRLQRMVEEVPVETGWVEPALREEFRGLGLRATLVTARTGRSPRELKVRLRHLSDRIQGTLGLRIARRGEYLAGDRVDLPDGAIVVADERRPIGLVFGDTGSAAAVGQGTRRITLCVVRVPGIPEISVEEALWTAAG